MATLAIAGGTPVRNRPYPRWPEWDHDERRRLTAVVESGQWWSTGGREVPAFEAAWAARCGVEQAIAVTNGTHALELALLGAGIGEGDEVIVPDYTFVASASAVMAVNAVPVLVDIDPGTFCIDPTAVEAAITQRTRAIIAVHLAGHPADLDRLTATAERHGIALIEDCAHAHGSEWHGRPVGGFGAAGSWSFQQSKLMTAGEGGAVTCQDASVAAAVRSFADCGRRPGEWFYAHFVLGSNDRMTEWQAAVLLAQLRRFDDQHRRRNEHGLMLNRALAEIPGIEPQARDDRTTAQGYYCYVVRLDEQAFGAPRDLVLGALEAEGLPLTRSYPPIHTLDLFAHAAFAPRVRTRAGHPDYAKLDLPRSRQAAAETIWFQHQLLLGSADDAGAAVEAFAKIRANLDELRAVGAGGQ